MPMTLPIGQKGQRAKRTMRKGFWDYFYEFFSGSAVRTITYIILGVILVLIIYRIIVVNNLFMTASSRRRKKGTEELEIAEIDDNNLDRKDPGCHTGSAIFVPPSGLCTSNHCASSTIKDGSATMHRLPTMNTSARYIPMVLATSSVSYPCV